MIQPKQSCLSLKQNISPRKKHFQQHSTKVFNQQVLLSTINDLQLLLTSHGIKIPQNNLLVGSNQQDLFALRTVVNSPRKTSEQQMKKIKVELSNYQFELKKNEQDIAQWKLKTKMENDKQVKKLRLEISKLEQQMKEDNGKWESKFEEMRKLYEAKYATDLDEALKRMNEQIKSLQHQHEHKMEELVNKIKIQRKQILIENLCKIQEIEKQSLCELKEQEEKFVHQKEAIKDTHIKHVEELQMKQQHMIEKMKQQNVKQKRKQEEFQIELASQKQKMENKVQSVIIQKDHFLKVIDQLKYQIEQLKKDMGNKEQACKNIQQNHKRILNNINSNHQQQLQLLKANHNNEMRKLLKENDQKMIEYQKIVQNLESIKQKRQKLLRQAQEQLEQKFLQRPARSEDVTKIQKLNHDLMHKHQQLNCTKVELKKNKLERQNNERNYTRLFSASGTRRYSREKQRDRIFRQVNTIDMSFVYKACHKNF